MAEFYFNYDPPMLGWNESEIVSADIKTGKDLYCKYLCIGFMITTGQTVYHNIILKHHNSFAESMGYNELKNIIDIFGGAIDDTSMMIGKRLSVNVIKDGDFLAIKTLRK